MEMAEEEIFRIVIDEETNNIEAMDIQTISQHGHKVWRWIKSGADRVLNLSGNGLASAADKVKKQIQLKLGGEWEVSQISLTISSSPSATITIERKPGSR